MTFFLNEIKTVARMKKSILIGAILLPLSIWGQKNAHFSVEVSSDTIGMKGSIEVVFTLENAQSKAFSPPSFDGFDAQGPATSMMTSINNGAMSQTTSYTFYLSPRSVGSFEIGFASVNTEGGILKTEEKKVVVVEHYDAEIRPKQSPRSLFDSNDDFFFRRPSPPQQPKKSKKKYQTEKI
jgi:hypothetical protein